MRLLLSLLLILQIAFTGGNAAHVGGQMDAKNFGFNQSTHAVWEGQAADAFAVNVEYSVGLGALITASETSAGVAAGYEDLNLTSQVNWVGEFALGGALINSQRQAV